MSNLLKMNSSVKSAAILWKESQLKKNLVFHVNTISVQGKNWITAMISLPKKTSYTTEKRQRGPVDLDLVDSVVINNTKKLLFRQ